MRSRTLKFCFLGDASGIGASSAVADFGDTRLVFDCGVRLQGSPQDGLPDLVRLEDGPPPVAVLITHAHVDRIGALPIWHQRFPGIPVYATPPTADLTRIQLLDALHIMADEQTLAALSMRFNEETGWRLLVTGG